MKEENNPDFQYYFDMNFGIVPSEELYDKRADPDMIANLAQDQRYAEITNSLRQKLNDYLVKTEDPRANGATFWDEYYLDK